MANALKTQKDILEKLNIHQLNPMQEEAIGVICANTNTILLSPTGTGKTLAFLLPIIEILDPNLPEIQALILVPSRELALQIEQVIREMGSGYKVNAVYGGRAMAKDKTELKHAPTILIGTPGRISDHIDNERITTKHIKTLILDEFDKSLEVGFEDEMKFILGALPAVRKRILTSATESVRIPAFVRLQQPKTVNYLGGVASKLTLKTVLASQKNKLATLFDLIQEEEHQSGIVFCNLRESILKVSRFLDKNNIVHGCFHGDMEQKERERTLIKFRNGSYKIIIATDLAARGIDIPELKYIVHLELPLQEKEFTHRNGRTARVNAKGTAYVLQWEKEVLPDFIKDSSIVTLGKKAKVKPPYWQTLLLSGGRKDKISKGDIAGLFFKQGNIHPDQLGVIELKQDCTFVAVPVEIAQTLATHLNKTKLKQKKVRITLI
ncbi:DEAD/DEAH box helicase [Arenibacter sp. GZD96]|uniref:DEAD/DEAH box helicase n=1 Tax=Aurantibrevibacter litoralis TaxID=3106030 RepID=UPI002B040050|nr:DEAD/DEAH box helicase [Arenibacter sp. GZD-96]MEA1785358.1 DEAD/DEAH box helicase [Arenibacter sp. GZD-96]